MKFHVKVKKDEKAQKKEKKAGRRLEDMFGGAVDSRVF